MRHNASRRAFLKGTAGAALGSAVLAGTASAQETAKSDSKTAGSGLKTWFANTDNATKVVDKRGESEVTVEVGVEGNGGSFAFGPAAVRIDPGTRVVWEWTGKGGSHNVVAEDGSFESDTYGVRGKTFEHTPSEAGVVKYACAPHKPMGMKGALVVGDATASLGSEEETKVEKESFDGWLAETDNYTRVVDKRGEEEVVVDVGTAANGGRFGFSPAAVRVSPGTKVVWRWVDAPGSYNVAALDGSFRSEFVSDPGHEFAQTFATERTVKYGCEAYADLGMKGVVVVGDGEPGVQLDGADAGMLAGAGVGAATLLSPLGLGLAMHLGRKRSPDDRSGEFWPDD